MLSLQIAASGMIAQEQRTETVANNLANMNTSGFQRRRMGFSSLISKNLRRPDNVSSSSGESVPSGVNAGLGVQSSSIYRVSEQGHLKKTENSLDLAVQGSGYLQVLLPNGEVAYTRDGSFQLSPDGQIVTHDGYPLQPAINIQSNAEKITINSSGVVLVTLPGQEDPANVGSIQLALFPNEGGLDSMGNNLLIPTTKSGDPVVISAGSIGAGTLIQGFIEASNVNPIQEVAQLIRAQRAYDMNSKVMQTADQMMKTRS